MASRLPVVLVHTSPAGVRVDVESIVGEVIGIPEIDIALVGPLGSLTAESTDCLNMDSIDGDFAILDWATPLEIAERIGQLGITGNRAQHAHDEHADDQEVDGQKDSSPAQIRRWYCFDLRNFGSAGEVCRALGQLKDRRKVRTFGISLGGATITSAKPSVASNPPLPPVDSTQPSSPARGSIDVGKLVDELDELDP